MHGKGGLVGAANPAWKNGKHSQLIHSLGLGDAYDRMVDSPELGRVREAIAIWYARHWQLVERLKDQEATWATYAAASKALAEYDNAMASKKLVDALGAMEMLRKILDAGRVREQTWGELQGVDEHWRKLADTEGKTLERLQSMLSADQARSLISHLYNAVVSKINAGWTPVSALMAELRTALVGQDLEVLRQLVDKLDRLVEVGARDSLNAIGIEFKMLTARKGETT